MILTFKLISIVPTPTFNSTNKNNFCLNNIIINLIIHSKLLFDMHFVILKTYFITKHKLEFGNIFDMNFSVSNQYYILTCKFNFCIDIKFWKIVHHFELKFQFDLKFVFWLKITHHSKFQFIKLLFDCYWNCT